MEAPKKRRPGDIILERYLPGITDEEREVARESLRRLVRLLIRVHERLALDHPQSAIRTIADDLPLRFSSKGI